jgi:diacylglycerol kinase family enzyme
VVVVYNPNSGKKRNVREEIKDIFSKRKVDFDFHETKGYMDAWNYVKNLEIDQVSCIVAVGGDGTIHEVVNGLMFREDQKKVPLAFIPNGSGNDTCGSIGIHSID